MRGHDIRTTFLDFFAERGHKVFPSASLIPEDPTLLLTVAGMVPFKPYFSGQRPIEFLRAVSAQVCARTNDIENVGVTARHQTVFEMLGNFSFGDYYKREAIEWAWELSLEKFGLDPDRIWASVFETDEESFAIWRDVVGLPEARIVRRGAEDNFWSMGVAGPAGLTSELFYDRGPAFGDVKGFEDGDRIMEYYNLVFTEFEVNARNEVIGDLPMKNVDTGMGLERITQILQEVPTAYETDLLKPMIDAARDLTGRAYGEAQRTDMSLRIIGEHARAATFLIGDGVQPSNEGRGYVLRRLLRRAVRHARLLGTDAAVMPTLVQTAVATMGEAYPGLVARAAFIEQIAASEEENFSNTLRTGLTRLEADIDVAKAANKDELPADVPFTLHDTFGFPFELTLEIAEEAGLKVDRAEFDRLMDEQRDRARSARKVDLGDDEALRAILRDAGASAFTGYDRLADDAKVVGLVRAGARVEAAQEGDEVEVILDATPFYPEGGGQVGDDGVIETDGARLIVTDTRRRLGDLIVHMARVERGEVVANSAANARVDALTREATQRSHTATHIVHATLRAALGDHAHQAGSLVEPGRLRFDFAHFERVPHEVLDEVEAKVNARLLADEPVRPYETTMDEARARGAMMLFEEKYGDIVRVVEIGDYSIELCGGIHVTRTSQVGGVKLLGEGSISSGIRRIEALSGAEAIADWRRSRAVLEHIAALLKSSPDDAPAKVEKLLADLKVAEGQIRKSASAGTADRAKTLAAGAQTAGTTSVVVAEVPGLNVAELAKLAASVRDHLSGACVVILAGATENAAGIAVAIDKVTAGAQKAAVFISDAAKAIGGGAGGRDDVAQGGGKNTSGVSEALRLARANVEELLA